MKPFFKSIRFKIILFTLLCVTVVQVASTGFLSHVLIEKNVQERVTIEEAFLRVIQNSIEENLVDLNTTISVIRNDRDVCNALLASDPTATDTIRLGLQAQKALTMYLSSLSCVKYVNKIIMFNENGVSFQSTASRYSGSFSDIHSILSFVNLESDYIPLEEAFTRTYPSICLQGQRDFVVLERVWLPTGNAYMYLEINKNIISETLNTFADERLLFCMTSGGEKLASTKAANAAVVQSFDPAHYSPEEPYLVADEAYSIRTCPLSGTDLTLYVCTNLQDLYSVNLQQTNLIIAVIITSLLVAAGLIYIVMRFLTRSIHVLIARLQRISENDFSYDPTIEASGDEIGEIGRAVNEMVCSVDNLIKEIVQAGDEKLKIEFALLQSQVNPHFLYNTLDSIRWVAVIQGNQEIVKMTKSLSNLLRNIAKGVSDKITLAEEISLLRDYENIQAVRYMDSFHVVYDIAPEALDYKIVKMTLQPLMENAIFHGIEPKGVSGIITVTAKLDNEYLCICVHDTGVGMTQEEIQQLLQADVKPGKDSLSGIGISNINHRLHSVYGGKGDLRIESVKGEYTSMLLCIPAER